MSRQFPPAGLLLAALLFALLGSAILGSALLGSAASALAAEKPAAFTFGYVQRADDPAYAERRAYTGVTLRQRHRPIDGAKVALRESRVLGRAQGLAFDLEEIELTEGEDAAEAIGRLSEGPEGVTAFLLDLPLGELARTVEALAGRDLLLFNIRHRDDELRDQPCSPLLFHSLASNAMLMDGLAQYLARKDWRRVLVLEGALPEDAILSAAFQASARKFGVDVVGVERFVTSNDPRLRDQSAFPLLTQGVDHNVVFLADSLGDQGRYLPYQTYYPRPVIGSEGLVAGAWHWTWERHGAPQLNQRFDRLAGRRMAEEDWAAWAAVKAVVEAVVRSGGNEPAALRAYLRSDEMTLDTYKGAPGNFRPWNNQLRQPVLLHTHNAVIARAPIDGFLHEKNNLDTLGRDLRESACRLD